MSTYIKEIKSIPVDGYGDVRTLVRGLPFQCPNDWKDVLDSLNEDSELYLIKEPDNPKDDLAIAAYLGDRKIGYVASDDNCQVWMFLTDEKTPCKLIKKYEASLKVAFDNPRQLFESIAFEDIYKDREGWIEKNQPIMKVPFLTDNNDDSYDWYRDIIIISDFEEYIPDFRRKLASKMITFIARKNSKGNYRYYLPYINAGVAAVEDDVIKNIIDTDGFVIAIPDLSFKTYPGGIHIDLNVARLKKRNPLLKEFRAVVDKGDNELVFYLKTARVVHKNKKADKDSTAKNKTKKSSQKKVEKSTDIISREYFNQIDKLSTDLNVFVNKTLIKSRRVLKEIDNNPFYGYRFSKLKDYEIFVRLFVMYDFRHIYKTLRCNQSIFKDVGKLLFIYAMKELGQDKNVNFEIFKEMCNPNSTIDVVIEYRQTIENFIDEINKEKIPYYPVKGFLMQEILEDENVELLDKEIKYKELMSQFATTIANAKGKLTAKQKEWLSQLDKP